MIPLNERADMSNLNLIWNQPHAQAANHWLAMLGLSVAMLCIFADQYALSVNPQPVSSTRLWRWCAALLLLLALADWLRMDYVLVVWLRDIARGEGWYGLRRPLQLAALVLALYGGLAASSRALRLASRSDSAAAQKTAIFGMTLLLVLLCVRMVSFHYTDRLLDAHVLGASVGSWLDLTGLALIAAGALRHLAHTYTYRA